jgi:hypothetical protein
MKEIKKATEKMTVFLMKQKMIKSLDNLCLPHLIEIGKIANVDTTKRIIKDSTYDITRLRRRIRRFVIGGWFTAGITSLSVLQPVYDLFFARIGQSAETDNDSTLSP